ncbi:MAG: chloride channel protein, partial [Bdellovibrionales bacterium]|nr:chloride channel protein [Bdellovibrionales bacterium]
SKGSNLILDEIHKPKRTLPFAMAPLVLFGTLCTHLFGGSSGREGTAVQIGATLADQWSRISRVKNEQRNLYLMAGMGAGFAAAIGAPWAGTVFGLEAIHVGKLRMNAWVECFIASFSGYYTTVVLKAPHSLFPKLGQIPFSIKTAFFVFIAGIFFGVVAGFFSKLIRGVEYLLKPFNFYPPLKPFVGGIVLLFFYYLVSSNRYLGLGIPVIQEALNHQVGFLDPMYKIIFSALTIGSGFKGGEFIPLVFIGTTLGSALSVVLPVSSSVLAATGFAAVFGGAANAPLACSLMAVEIFGWSLAPYAFIACFASYFCSGHMGIYRSQKILLKKHQWFLSYYDWMRSVRRR